MDKIQIRQTANKNLLLNQLKHNSGNIPGLPYQTVSKDKADKAKDARDTLHKEFVNKYPVMGAAREAAAYAGQELTGKTIGQAASEFTTSMKTILKDIGTVYEDDRNIIFSAIYTIMDAVNNSVMGGLAGLESELEKIVNEENANNSGEPNAALEFLGDCANFIRFFLEYLYYNKKLKINKHLIKKIAKAQAEKKAAQEAKMRASRSQEAAAAARKRVEEADEKLKDLLELQKEANDKASIRTDTEQNDELTKHNKYIEYLNNAFKHLVFTYGQLSGRTIYNIIKFLQRGGPPEVGWFDPISFGSLGSTMIRSTPPGAIAGQVMDSVVDFFKALAGASEASYKSLKKERELANEYMAYITDDTKEHVGGTSGTTDPIKIEEETFVKYYDSVKAEKKDKKGKDKNYKKRIQKLTGNKGRTNTNQNISDLTTGNIEKRIKDVRNAMLELNHVDNLKTLLKYIVDYNSIKALTKSANIYVKGSSILNTKDDSKIKLLTKDEVFEMRKNSKVKKVFNKLIKNFDITNVSPDKDKLGELTIEKSNPQLYGIVMNFIRNNYKSAEDQVEELEKRIKTNPDDSVKFEDLLGLLKKVVEAENKLEEAEKKLEEAEKKKGLEEEKKKVEEAKQGLEEAEKKVEKKKVEGAGSMKIDELINEKLLKLVAVMKQDSVEQDDSGDQLENNTKNVKSWFRLYNKAAKTIPDDTSVVLTTKSVPDPIITRKKDTNIIVGENTDSEDANDKEKLANITREIANLNKIVTDENKRIKQLSKSMEDTSKSKKTKKPKEGKEFLEEEYNLLLEQLNSIKLRELGSLNTDIHNSGDYGKLAAIFVKLKREMKAEIQRLVTDLKPEDISIKGQEKLEIVKSGLKKMLEFIRYREFGSINALFKRERKSKTRRGGGDLSNIRRHIAKATRRIETTLSNFNNTRRNKRIKPRKTRRVNYSH